VSHDHDANRARAIAALGIDPEAPGRIPIPIAHADSAAAPAAPSVPHGGMLPAGLREFGSMVGDAVGHAARAISFPVAGYFASLASEKGEPVVIAPTRTLPACMKAVRLLGGASTVGHSLRGLECVAPSWVTKTNDFSFDEIAATEDLAFIPRDVEQRLLAAMPKHPVIEAETDSATVARLVPVLERETTTMRAFASSQITNWSDASSVLPRLVDTLLCFAVQDMRLDPALAAHTFLRAWRAPSMVDRRLDGSPVAIPGSADAAIAHLAYAKLDAVSLVSMAAGHARERFLYDGTAHDSAPPVADLNAQIASMAAAHDAQRAALDATQLIAPKSAGLIVARRPKSSLVIGGDGPALRAYVHAHARHNADQGGAGQFRQRKHRRGSRTKRRTRPHAAVSRSRSR
jgi:hypothetical protein